ncbi:MAG: hypothetical protein ACI8RD_003827 [Bacillariaceae sp.]|jgi:hypothetical protein
MYFLLSNDACIYSKNGCQPVAIYFFWCFYFLFFFIIHCNSGDIAVFIVAKYHFELSVYIRGYRSSRVMIHFFFLFSNYILQITSVHVGFLGCSLFQTSAFWLKGRFGKHLDQSEVCIAVVVVEYSPRQPRRHNMLGVGQIEDLPY